MSRINTSVSDATSVDAALASRMSARAFLPREVPRELITEILGLASRAPSGSNIQPWRVYVLQGQARDSLVKRVCAAHDAQYADPRLAERYQEEYAYYPRQWFEPYLGRRRENGWGLYGLLGIERGEKDKMHAQHHRNFLFFDAPVGLIFTIDRELDVGSLIDYGMFLQSIMLAARARGLHTCPQAAWNRYGSIILPHVGAGANEMLVCGMALGWADAQALVNTFDTPRKPVESFAQWVK